MYRTDADGIWKKENGIESLIEPSQAWIENNPVKEPVVEKTPLEILQEENAALQAKSNELQEQLAQTNTDMQAFMDFIFETLIPQ